MTQPTDNESESARYVALVCMECCEVDHYSVFGMAVPIDHTGWRCRQCLCPFYDLVVISGL